RLLGKEMGARPPGPGTLPWPVPATARLGPSAQTSRHGSRFGGGWFGPPGANQGSRDRSPSAPPTHCKPSLTPREIFVLGPPGGSGPARRAIPHSALPLLGPDAEPNTALASPPKAAW